MLVRSALSSDLLYVDSLRRTESEQIGFLPWVAYERVLEGQRPAQRLWLATIDDERVGFLYATPGPDGGSLHIMQLAVQRDARRREYGLALTVVAETYAQATQRQGVTARVAADIEATAFWDSLDYELRGYEVGGMRRGRVMERRYKRLPLGLEALG